MLRAGWLILGLVMAVCTGAAAAAPGKEATVRGTAAAKQSAPLPKVRFVGRKAGLDGLHLLHFTVEPAAKAPGWVLCFPTDPQQERKKGVLQPLFGVELKRNGKWESQRGGWCATGAFNARVDAGTRATFSVPEFDGDWQAMRVGVTWTAAAATETRTTVWSQPVRR